jgi:hypothetical protein
MAGVTGLNLYSLLAAVVGAAVCSSCTTFFSDGPFRRPHAPIEDRSLPTSSLGERRMLGTVLLVVLVLLLIGAIPSWPHSRSWGYGPSGVLGLIAVVVLVLLGWDGYDRIDPRRRAGTAGADCKLARQGLKGA